MRSIPSRSKDASHERRPFYYGWVLAWMLGPTQLVTWGVVYYSFSVMLAPMQREMGWSAAEVTGAFSLALLTGGLAAPWVGRWLDGHGPRLLMTLGVAASSLLVLAWANVQTLPGFYAIWLGLGPLMAAVLYEPAFWIIARWFSGAWLHRRGRALTVLTFFGGLASTLFIPLSNALQQSYGWRQALVILAVALASGTILPYALLLRSSPRGEASPALASPSQGANRSVWCAEMRRPTFWLLTLVFALTGMAGIALSVHLIAYEISRGQDPAFVAAAAGMIGVMQVVGRLMFTPLGDRFSPRRVAALLCLFQAGAVAALLALPTRLGLMVYVVLFGIGHGAMTPMRVTLVADAFGVRSYGRISGAIAFVVTFARAVGPVALGVAAASMNSYTPALFALMLASLVAAVAVLQLDR